MFRCVGSKTRLHTEMKHLFRAELMIENIHGIYQNSKKTTN